MPASADCAQAIEGSLAKKGVAGRKTNQAAINHVERARVLILEARRREEEITACGLLTLARVQEIVDLYKDATEKLASVSDETKEVERKQVRTSLGCTCVGGREGEHGQLIPHTHTH